MEGCEYNGADFCPALTSSSEVREDDEDTGFRGGEFKLDGTFEPRHCAACDGTVIVVIVLVVVLVF